MQITELKVTIGEVCDGYFNGAEEGVIGYNELLDIRPKYQTINEQILQFAQNKVPFVHIQETYMVICSMCYSQNCAISQICSFIAAYLFLPGS